MTINSNGTRLASGGLDGYIKIWDVQTINLFFRLLEQGTLAAKSKKTQVLSAPSSHDLNNATVATAATTSVETDHKDLDLPDKSLCRPLCSMSRHNGVVTSLKFSPDGRWLASGSDDKIVLIWEKDDTQRPKAFGVEQEDLEHWTVRKRLVAHDNDIQDICWSPDGNLLVTVGLDRSIIIWNAITFERIKRYDIHQSMVKGIVFDPANKFFATASDDRTVRIFRYHKKLNEYNKYEFQMEHVVVDPFKKSPLTSYFRRMSWSPDGQHIAVPNATNGPVPSVAIINRGNWGSDVSLIGHEAPVEVCSFSPCLFQVLDSLDDEKKTEELKFQTILATGGQDRTLAIWSTSNSKPIVVCLDIVYNSITDICWSPDGETLYFSCLDGSITCVRFEIGELGKVISADLIDKQLNKYGTDRESTILPESVEQLQLEEKAKDARALSLRLMMPLQNRPQKGSDTKAAATATPLNLTLKTAPGPTPISATAKQPSSQVLVPSVAIDTARLRKQIVTITKSGKKRVAPLLVSSSSSSSSSSAISSSSSSSYSHLSNAALTQSLSSSLPNSSSSKPREEVFALKKRKLLANSSKLSHPTYNLPKAGISTVVCGIKRRDLINATVSEEQQGMNNDFDDLSGVALQDNTNNNASQLSESALRRLKNKEKRKILEKRYPTTFRDVTHLPQRLFNSVALQNRELSKIYKAYANNKDVLSEISAGSSIEFDEDLVFSVVLAKINHKQIANADLMLDDVGNITTTIEIRNGKPWSMVECDHNLVDRDFDDPTKVVVYNNDPNDNENKRQFTLFFPFRIQLVMPIVDEHEDGGEIGNNGKSVSLRFFLLFSFNGSIQIVSAQSGRYILPTIELHENVVFAKYRKDHLLVLTRSGLFYGWNLRTLKAYMKRVSIAPVLNSTDLSEMSNRSILAPIVKSIEMNDTNGLPYVLTDASSSIYGYSLDMRCWVNIFDSWYYNVADETCLKNISIDLGFREIFMRLEMQQKEDALMGKINTYTFPKESEDIRNKLKDVMQTRLEESVELI